MTKEFKSTPETIILAGQECGVKLHTKQTHLSTYPLLILNKKPIAGLEAYDGVLDKEKLDIAEKAVESFIQNNQQWNGFNDHDFSVTSLDDIFKRDDLSFDFYDNFFGQKFFVVESNSSSAPRIKINVWERSLCEKFYNHIRKNKKDFRGRAYPDFEAYFDFCEF